VPRPRADRLAPRRAHAPRYELERLVPGDAAQLVATSRARKRRQQAARVANDLARGLTPNTQEATAIRVVRVSANADEFSALDVNQHPA
jgi:hypothetical protein